MFKSGVFVMLSFEIINHLKVEDLESRQLVEAGQPGELLIKGPQVQKTMTKTNAKTKTTAC